MRSDASLWNQASAYDYWDDLTSDGLAWEFLRRNMDYRQAYQAGTADASHWGLRRLHDPKMTAQSGTIFWSPGLNASEILLTSLTELASSATPLPLLPPSVELDETGQYGIMGRGVSKLPVSCLNDQLRSPATAICIIIPLDGDLPDRIDALRRFWRLTKGNAAPDRRVTTDKRKRLRLMARASDGRACGASHRQVAEALFGRAGDKDEPWKTSSLRYTTLRLVQDAGTMIAHGYLDLLRTPPNKSAGLI